MGQWRKAWERADEVPRCHVVMIDGDHYLLIDTRPVAKQTFVIMTAEEAFAALMGSAGQGGDDLTDWALSRHLCIRYEDRIVPLATADPDVYLSIDERAKDGLRAFGQRSLTDPLTSAPLTAV